LRIPDTTDFMSVVLQFQPTLSTIDILTRLRTDLDRHNSIIIRKRVKEALIKWLFSTVRGSGWPGLKRRHGELLLVDSWPSATANGTE